MIATANARATTIGVYTRAKRVMKRSILGLEDAAFSTASRILVTRIPQEPYQHAS